MNAICKNCVYWNDTEAEAGNQARMGWCALAELYTYVQEYHSCEHIVEKKGNDERTKS